MFRFAIIAVAILAPGLALAQDKPLSVYFEPCKDQQLNDAITIALSGIITDFLVRYPKVNIVAHSADRMVRETRGGRENDQSVVFQQHARR